MPVVQVAVISQFQAGGEDSCGYHTLKNALLCLMLQRKMITNTKFNQLVSSRVLFDSLYNKTKTYWNNSYSDLSLPRFLKKLEEIENGKYEFSADTCTAENLSSLNLVPNGGEDLSVVNLSERQGYALTGMEHDLTLAATIAQLNQRQDEYHHVFAVGINDEHWVTAALHQTKAGAREWLFMDSFDNQIKYKYTVIRKIEEILIKSPMSLQRYLINVYQSTNRTFEHSYYQYFTPLHKPYQGSFPVIDELFVKKNINCGFLLMHRDPSLCPFSTIKPLLSLADQATISIIKFGANLYFVNPSQELVYKLEQFGNPRMIENLHKKFRPVHVLAQENELEILQEILTPNAKKHFVDDKDNLKNYTDLINNRFKFMMETGWLNAPSEEVKPYIRQLYSISHFTIMNLDETDKEDLEVKEMLAPICQQLSQSLGLPEPEIVEPRPNLIGNAVMA